MENDGGSANSHTLDVSTTTAMAPKRDKRALGSPEPATSPLRAPVPPPPLTTTPDEVKVNPYNASELKVALDDALKRYAANDETGFRRVNRHTDVKLVLGWSAVVVAALTAGYGYMVDFEKSKPAVWAGVVL
jgi:signal peptidase complex subunit 2